MLLDFQMITWNMESCPDKVMLSKYSKKVAKLKKQTFSYWFLIIRISTRSFKLEEKKKKYKNITNVKK